MAERFDPTHSNPYEEVSQLVPTWSPELIDPPRGPLGEPRDLGVEDDSEDR